MTYGYTGTKLKKKSYIDLKGDGFMSKRKPYRITKHHKKPKSIGGTNAVQNISHVPEAQHEAWHLLFSNMTVPTIVAILNEKWIDPDYEITARRRQ